MKLPGERGLDSRFPLKDVTGLGASKEKLEMLLRQLPNPHSEVLARMLMAAYLLCAVGYFFAGPIYERMSHGPRGWLSVEMRTAIILVNACAAALIIARYRFPGIFVLFLTGLLVSIETVGRGANAPFVLLMSFWDVAIFLMLELYWRRRKATLGHPN